jgi:DNA polymerase III alpha subunit
MMFNINNFDDPEVWDLICAGDTKGVFQLGCWLSTKAARI